MLGLEPMTYGPESECATHYTTAPHNKIIVNCNDMFAFTDFTVTRGHSYKLYAKTSCINVRHNFFCNRVVNVWNRLLASDSHFKTLKSFKLFLAAQTLTALSY